MCAKRPHGDFNRAKRPRDDSNEDSDTGSSHGSKRRRRYSQHDKKYDAIFELLTKVEERSERMELRAIENQKEAFRQAQLALDSYNMLSERILHAIVNIGGTSNVTE